MLSSRVLLAGLVAAAMAWPAAAADLMAHAPRRTVAASAADLFVIADGSSKGGDRRQAERILVLLSRDPSRDVRNEARYRRSLLLETAGDSKGSAALLRTILDEDPGASAVRVKLATTLHQMGDDDGALRQLRAVRSADLPPAVARFVDRISASLQASKPFGFQFEVALAPDSNINRATRSDTLGTIFGDFQLDENAKRKSGVGAAFRGVAHRRLSLGGDLSVVARASTDLNLYRDHRFNDFFAELSAGPELQVLGTRITAEAAVGQRWYGMKLYQRQLRLSASATRAVDAVSQLRIDASLRHANTLANALLDGRGLTLRAQYERALSPQMSVAASVTRDRFSARDAAYSTRSWTAGLSTSRDFGRMTVNVGAEIGRLKADERLEILPVVRSDKFTRLSFSTVFRQFTLGGFAPMMRIVRERNRSTVEFYDYKRTLTELGVSRAF